MTQRDFYKRALFLPVMVPILAWVVIYVDAITGAFSGKGVQVIGAAMVFAFGGLWGAIPYAFVAAVALLLLRRRSVPPTAFTAIALLAPVAVICTAAVLIVVLALVTRDFSYLKALPF